MTLDEPVTSVSELERKCLDHWDWDGKLLPLRQKRQCSLATQNCLDFWRASFFFLGRKDKLLPPTTSVQKSVPRIV